MTTLVSRTASTGRACIVNSPDSARTLLSSIRPHGFDNFLFDFRRQLLLGQAPPCFPKCSAGLTPQLLPEHVLYRFG